MNRIFSISFHFNQLKKFYTFLNIFVSLLPTKLWHLLEKARSSNFHSQKIKTSVALHSWYQIAKDIKRSFFYISNFSFTFAPFMRKSWLVTFQHHLLIFIHYCLSQNFNNQQQLINFPLLALFILITINPVFRLKMQATAYALITTCAYEFLRRYDSWYQNEYIYFK